MKKPITREFIKSCATDKDLMKLCGGDMEAVVKVQTVKAKYGDNKWWKSKDSREVALGQLQEEIMVMDFGDFHKAVEEACGRPVWTHEFADCQSLIEEIKNRSSEDVEFDFNKVMKKLTDLVGEEKVIVVTI